MPEITTNQSEELARLQERVRKLAMDKSYLQLIMNLMNKVSTAQGLDNMIGILLSNILNVIGGTNIILYYLIDDGIYYADLMGTQKRLDRIDDAVVSRVFESRESLEFEQDFGDTQMMAQEFTKAYTWVYPLLAGTELVGIIKLENLHIAMRELYGELPTLFTYVATVIKNEIFSHTQLKVAYDQMAMMNEDLEMEIEERINSEEELRAARDELEMRVAERTAALQSLNEQLQLELGERIRVEEALRASTAEIHDLYNHAPCGYHSLDADGAFILINDTELQWLGYSREEIIGHKKFTDLISAASLETFQANFPVFKVQGWIRDLEFEMVRRDGSLLPVLISATALYDQDGNYLMSRTAVYDITEHKKVEATEHLLSAIVQSSDDAIFAKDLNEVILSWNKGAEQIYGYSAEEAIGQSVAMLVPPEHLPELAEIMSTLRRGERIDHYTTERLRKDGKRIFVSLTVSPVNDAYGRIVAASAIARDITEQRRTEEEIRTLNKDLEKRVEARTDDLKTKRRELEESQRALMNIVEDLNDKTTELEEANTRLQELERLKSMFIASMSHELRTPLNSIIGFSSILHDEWLGQVNTEQKENLAIILRSGKHLLSLINDVIDVSKIEAGKIETATEEFDLYELVMEGIAYVAKDIRDKGLGLTIEVAHLAMTTDRQRLLQCLLNLLSNAMKFTEKGEVSITARAVSAPGGSNESPFVEISVTDSGIGIREEDLPKMFNPFVRLVPPGQATIPGTGLGLYLTRKLAVEILRGDILLMSEYGKGSCFTIKIPVRIP